jgi:hypothetical protein
MTDRTEPGFPPAHVTTILRIEGLAIFAATLAAYHLIGGNWWLYALLILAPDLSMFGLLAGEKIGARAYNLAHTYTVPVVLGGIALIAGAAWLLPVAVIWASHIALDRALGYGLKYPDVSHATHLGWIGKAKKRNATLANAG